LADFAAQEGMAIESNGAAAPKPAEKTMGPAQKIVEK